MRYSELFENTYAVYHGTDQQFNNFDNSMLGSSNGRAPINTLGFNFTDNIEVAKSFGKNIIKAEITIERPYVIDAKGKNYSDFKHILNNKLDRYQNKFDGIIIKNYNDSGKYSQEYIMSNHYIPRNISQIKIQK